MAGKIWTFKLSLALAWLLLVPIAASAHGGEDHDEKPRGGLMSMVMEASAEPEFITYDAPTGRDVVIGRANPVEILKPEVVTDESGRKVKVYILTVEDVKFEISPGKTVEGWGFNGQIPGPVIRITEGDRFRIVLANRTRDEHTIHIHGQKKHLTMDGVPYLGQEPTRKGETYVYEFTANRPGTHWYHCHVDSGHHVDMGMYGAFIVEPKKEKLKFDRQYTLIVDEWPGAPRHSGAMAEGKPMGEGMEPSAGGTHGMAEEAEEKREHGGKAVAEPAERHWYPKTYNPYTPVYDTFTINGRTFPFTEPLEVREGERVRIRIINAGYEPHFMHLHAHPYEVVARDGNPVKNPETRDTVEVGPGQRVDILLHADNPGVWPFHCHNLRHVANDNIYPGGMLTFVRYVDE